MRVYPGFIQVATRKDHYRAIGIWSLARSLDKRGSGFVGYEELVTAAQLHWSEDKCYRAIREARAFGIIQTEKHTQSRVVRYYGVEKVARIFGIESVGAFAVEVEPKALRTASTFKAALFAAFHAGRTAHRPISRATMSDLTGISRHTQERYERLSGSVKAEANYEIVSEDPNTLNYFREEYHGACTIRDGKVVRRLPNIYICTLKRYGTGRAKKINEQLSSGLVKNKRHVGHRKVYYGDSLSADNNLKAAERSLRRTIDTPGMPSAFSNPKAVKKLYAVGEGLWKKLS